MRPDFADGHSNLGNVLLDLGRPDEALPYFEEALRLEPANSEYHKQVGTLLLLNGDWKRGWQENEWRKTGTILKSRKFCAAGMARRAVGGPNDLAARRTRHGRYDPVRSSPHS